MPHDRKRAFSETGARKPSSAGRIGAAQLDPKASAALAQAVISARMAGPGAHSPGADREQRLHLPRRGFDRTRQIVVHSALILVLAGSCWFAASAGNVTNRATLQQIAADTAQHRAALARLDHNLEAMGTLVGGIRDRAEETAASALEARRRLEEEIARVAVVAAGPGERLAALESRLEGLERQIAAALQSLAPRPEAPPVQSQTRAEAKPPEPDAAPAAPPPARTVVTRDEEVSGWTLRDVYGGMALIESRNRRLFEVVPGGFIPGIGRVSAIERRNGRWIVLTDKGVITALR
ncbi:MAG: hypothetical protein ABW360_00295 [Phenylobacterium sp.]